MNMPLDIAVDIGRRVVEARTARTRLDVSGSADEIASLFPQVGMSRRQILEVLREEAGAAGVPVN